MTTTAPLAAWVCGTVILLAVLAGVFALAWHGVVTGSAVIVIVSTIVAGALGLIGGHVGATSVVRTMTAIRGGKD